LGHIWANWATRTDDLVKRLGELAIGALKLSHEALQQYIKSSAATTLISIRRQRFHTSTRTVKCGANKNPTKARWIKKPENNLTHGASCPRRRKGPQRGQGAIMWKGIIKGSKGLRQKSRMGHPNLTKNDIKMGQLCGIWPRADFPISFELSASSLPWSCSQPRSPTPDP
jgi:hypothetical protein